MTASISKKIHYYFDKKPIIKTLLAKSLDESKQLRNHTNNYFECNLYFLSFKLFGFV